MTWFEAPWWGCHSSDVGLSFFRIEYAFLMNDLIGTVVDDSAQSTAESVRIWGMARSRRDQHGRPRKLTNPNLPLITGSSGTPDTMIAGQFV